MNIESILRGHGINTVIIPSNSITTAKLADSSVTGAKIVDGTITAVEIADGTLTNAKLASDAKVGSLAALNTTAKSDVVSAINELKQTATDLQMLMMLGGI